MPGRISLDWVAGWRGIRRQSDAHHYLSAKPATALPASLARHLRSGTNTYKKLRHSPTGYLSRARSLLTIWTTSWMLASETLSMAERPSSEPRGCSSSSYSRHESTTSARISTACTSPCLSGSSCQSGIRWPRLPLLKVSSLPALISRLIWPGELDHRQIVGRFVDFEQFHSLALDLRNHCLCHWSWLGLQGHR
ncbi:hypothetical protein D9M69_467300 [compost metagenome]